MDNLPIESIEQLEELEKSLIDDNNNRKRLVSMFISIL